MNRGLKERRTRRGETVEVAFERATFGKRRCVDQRVFGGRLKFSERSTHDHAELRHASRRSRRKAALEALPGFGLRLGTGVVGENSLDETFKHG